MCFLGFCVRLWGLGGVDCGERGFGWFIVVIFIFNLEFWIVMRKFGSWKDCKGGYWIRFGVLGCVWKDVEVRVSEKEEVRVRMMMNYGGDGFVVINLCWDFFKILGIVLFDFWFFLDLIFFKCVVDCLRIVDY